MALTAPVAVEFKLPSGLTLAGWRAAPQLELPSQPVLCLHGWLDNANSFLPLASALPELPLLALDLAGHGHSSHRSADAHYYLFDYVADIATLCRQQGWQQLIIIGHSMGGMIATVLAASFPELVSKLVLVDSLGLMTTTPAETAIQLRKAVISRLQSHQKQKPQYATQAEAATARQQQSDFDLATAMLLTERGCEPTAAGFSWRADVKLREVSAFRMSDAQARAVIRNLQCPVLALMSAQSPSEILHATQQFQVDYPQLKLVQCPGGHHLHMTDAVFCANEIRRFVSAQLV
ncbi:alpha/beta hydrolase [Rheinheimera texasensis]|uniref:alpha/beta hydrolase n=1 Tax=Rheinheimera texasensis TaxID=306205 RepID=UPI000689D60E|nr:alpha/beta hydrolase [Rheinheimera texasensis]